MKLNERYKLNNKGLTFIEVIAAASIGIFMLLTLVFLPMKMFESQIYISETIKTNEDINILSSYLHKDISKGVTNVVQGSSNCISLENLTDGSIKYCFSESGIIRETSEGVLTISSAPSSCSLSGEKISISIDFKSEEDMIEMHYFVKYPLLEKEVIGGE